MIYNGQLFLLKIVYESYAFNLFITHKSWTAVCTGCVPNADCYNSIETCYLIRKTLEYIVVPSASYTQQSFNIVTKTKVYFFFSKIEKSMTHINNRK